MAQSPELASGAGFAFEDQVGASYLVALLVEGNAAGTDGRSVTRVAFQQRDFGEPLDDLIVDATGADGARMRLSLQCKQSIRISDAASNEDFRGVIRDCWETRIKPDFRRGTNRYGAAVGHVAMEASRSLRTLCELARASESTAQFLDRFTSTGNASNAVRAVKEQVATILSGHIGRAYTEGELHDFLAHFVLLSFDFLHEGSTSAAAAMSQLSAVLPPSPEATAPLVWARLALVARESGGRSGEFSRQGLVRTLSASVRLLPVRSLRPDLDRLSSLAKSWIADIEPAVNGVRLERPDLRSKLEDALRGSRLVQISGLPGSGKSVLLRDRIEAALKLGPVLLLKHDRLTGRGWESFATDHGISNAPLKDLLAEMSASGSALVFIDGLDRIAKEQRGVVLDVVRCVLTDPELDGWRVIATMRSTSLESVSNWLSGTMGRTAVGTVEVGGLSGDEARVLAETNPALADLLFGSSQIREIARRPFFARVLAGASVRNPEEAPKSEVDLAARWWTRGAGFDLDEAEAVRRQLALLEIAGLSIRSLGEPVGLGRFTAPTAAAVATLVEDAVLTRTQGGHAVSFSHDIFLEWSLFHLLGDRGRSWLAELRGWGEPPAAGRAVELKSQSEFIGATSWPRTLREIQQSGMRTQWMRAWLIAPLSLPGFAEREAGFASLLFPEGATLCRSLLVWFQAERTVPNPRVLGGSEPTPERIRLADAWGWPSDFRTWQRFIAFLLRHVSAVPRPLRPLMLANFGVWQNACSGTPNVTSSDILRQCEAWLAEIDSSQRATGGHAPDPGDRYPSDFRASLVSLVLRSALSEPDAAERYLRGLLARPEITDTEFEEVVLFSPLLATTHPRLLTDVVLSYLREELPEDRIEAERRRREAKLARRQALRAKDPATLTEAETRFLAHPEFLHSWGLGFHDWERLAMERGRNFFPASPLREPFASLFREAPDDALRLVAELGNHAITAWRQLNSLDPERGGTPLPLEMAFPWGRQVFWGGSKEYLWGRGVWGPAPLQCAFLALEEWAIAQLESGADLDDLVRRVVAGHKGVAVLLVASSLALQADRVSEAVFPLVTSQRLLAADRERFAHDLSGSAALMIGCHPKRDRAHVEAIRAAQGRPARRRTLAHLISASVVWGGVFQARIREAVSGFPGNLEFAYEEQRRSDEVKESLAREAEQYSELADPANYRVYATANPDEVAVVHDSPSSSSPEAELARAEARKSLDTSHIWMWARKSLDDGRVGEGMELAKALAFARELDSPELFEQAFDESDMGQRQGAVAGVAALSLVHPDSLEPEDVGWAEDVVARAAESTGLPGAHALPITSHPWHHAVFATQGLAAEFLRRGGLGGSGPALLRLVGHQLEEVSLAAVGAALGVWDRDPRLGWCAVLTALRLLEIDTRRPPHATASVHPPGIVERMVADGIALYESPESWPVLPVPPRPWLEAEPGGDVASSRYRPGGSRKHRTAADQGWRPNPVQWHWQLAHKLFAMLPVRKLVAGPSRPHFLRFVAGVLDWLLGMLHPSWADPDTGREQQDQPYEFTMAFGHLLGNLCGYLALEESQAPFLTPILALPDEPCWDLLEPLVDTFVRVHVMDADRTPSDAPALLGECLSRLLRDATFHPGGYRSGKLHGYHMPQLVDALFLVNADDAPGSARFANGNWTEIGAFLPIVDRFVRAAGWSSAVMDRFLTLCERARATYPTEAFAGQVLATLNGPAADQVRNEWELTSLPARMAGLVQHFADRETPMDVALSRQLLRILDHLVDMGDRRAAALQSSEAFRQVAIGGPEAGT